MGLFVLSCGGAGPAAGAGPSLSPAESGETIVAIVISPTEGEREEGGTEVLIDGAESVDDWVNSPVFESSGWVEKGDESAARYRVSFRGRSGEVGRYYIGTLQGESMEYRCYGLCAQWWVAPALPDGSQDGLRYRVMEDAQWHPLAREWYMFSKYRGLDGEE